MTLEQITTFFGWMTVVNLLIYLWTAGFVILARSWITRVECAMMGQSPEAWERFNIDYLSRFKLAILVFNLSPWLALKIAF